MVGKTPWTAVRPEVQKAERASGPTMLTVVFPVVKIRESGGSCNARSDVSDVPIAGDVPKGELACTIKPERPQGRPRPAQGFQN